MAEGAVVADTISDDDFMAAKPAAPSAPSDTSGGLVIDMTPHPRAPTGMLTDDEFFGAKNQGKPLSNAVTDDGMSGAAKNFATSAIRGLSDIPGFAGNLQGTTDYLAQRLHALTSGRSMEDIQKERAQTDTKMRDATPSWMRNTRPPSGEDIAAPVLARTGEYHPTTLGGRLGSAATEVGTSMLGPGLASGARGLALARQIAAGTTAGGAGQSATEITGEPLAGLGAGTLIPAAGGYIGSKIGKVTQGYRPIPEAQRQPAADARFLANTQNPKAAIAKLSQPNEIIPGSKPRTAQVTMDPGHAIADELTAARDSQYRMDVKEQEAAQNTAQTKAMRTLSDPNADPAEVGQAFRDHLSNVEADQEAATQTAKGRATTTASPIQPIEAEEVGSRVRGGIGEAERGRYNHFNAAYDALDPEGKLNAVASPITGEAQAIRNAPDRDIQPLSPLAEDMVKRAELLKPVEPFSRIRAFDQALTKAMKKAKLTGDEGYEEIGRLKSAVKSAYANAAENQVKWEQQAVARGDMATEDTFAHKLAQSVKSYYEDRAGQTAGPNPAANAPRGSGSVSSENGAGARSGLPGSGEGLPSPNLTPETSQRLAQLNKEYGEFRSLYGADPIKSLLKTEGFKGQYGPNDAKVVSKVFPAGENGYEATSRALQASQHTPEALADMKSIAVSRLHNEMKGDALDPKELAAWKSKYGPALRAINEASPGFSEQFNNAAAATKTLNRAMADQKIAVADAQKGVAAKFLGLKDADDIKALMGSTMSAKNSGQQMTELVNRLKGNPAALEGAKKAATDWLMDTGGNAGVAAEGERVLSFPRIANFVQKNPTAVKTLFGDDGLKLLQNVSKDMERTQQLRTLQAAQGSPTAQRTLGKMIDEAVSHESGEGNTVGTMAAMGALMEVMEGNPVKAAGIFAAKSAMEKVSEMLEHRRGESLAEVHRMFKEGLTEPAVAKAMLERAVLANGKPNTAAFDKLMRSLNLLNYQTKEGEREHRASGGKVGGKIDYAAKATELLKLAQKAKKAHGDSSKPLLKMPDELIAGALKLAQQGPTNG